MMNERQKADLICQAQNTLGRFLQLYDLGRIADTKVLFSREGEVSLWLPDRDIQARGYQGVCQALDTLDRQRRELGYRRDLHVPHTPGYKTSDDGSLVLGTWDVFSFPISQREGGDILEYVYARIDATFRPEVEGVKFLRLDWYEISSFVPWQYHRQKDEGLSLARQEGLYPPGYVGKTGAEDFYEIQNTLTRWVHNNFKYALEDAFCEREDISLCMPPFIPEPALGRDQVRGALERLKQMQTQNLGKYIYVPSTSAPVIEVAPDGVSAQCQWLLSAYTFVGEAMGCSRESYGFIRRIGLLRADFVRENQKWRLHHLNTVTLLCLPEIPYDAYADFGGDGSRKRYQRMMLEENKWKPALPKLGGCYPQDAPVLETMMAMWVNAYRCGTITEYIMEHMVNDEFEIGFSSRGLGRQAPPVVGTHAMLERFAMPAYEYHHQQVTCHGGMSPDVEISGDGKYATVRVFDLNTTAYVPDMNATTKGTVTLNVPAGFSADSTEFEHTPSLYQLSIYEHTFARVDGQWKHIWVNWESLAYLPDLALAGRDSRGWAGCVTDEKFPTLWGKYHYSPLKKRDMKQRKNAQK